MIEIQRCRRCGHEFARITTSGQATDMFPSSITMRRTERKMCLYCGGLDTVRWDDAGKPFPVRRRYGLIGLCLMATIVALLCIGYVMGSTGR